MDASKNKTIRVTFVFHCHGKLLLDGEAQRSNSDRRNLYLLMGKMRI